MVGNSRKAKIMRLPGSTLVEVIIASIIMLVAFLLFTRLVAVLHKSRNINNEIKVLYTFPHTTPADVVLLKQYCPQCDVSLEDKMYDDGISRTITIKSKEAQKPILKYRVVLGQNSVDSLFAY